MKDISFMYTNQWDGLGVIFDTKQVGMSRYVDENYVYGIVNDGEKFVSPNQHA